MEQKLIELYRKLHDEGAYCFDHELPFSGGSKSAIIKVGGDYAVFLDTAGIETITEETELVAHECGHVATGATHSVCSPYDLVAKHEQKANGWAIRCLIQPSDIKEAMAKGYTEPWQIAEYLGRTEPFVLKAIAYYRRKCEMEAAS